MGTGKRFQRFLSLFLSLVMAVTLLPVQMAYAEGTNAPGSEANATSPGDGMGLPKELAHFSFDSETEIAGKVVGDVAKAKIVSEDNGRDSSPFLQLSGAAIRALDGSVLAGKKELTISYWSKSEGAPGWAFYAAKDNLAAPGDNYIGILDQTTSIEIQRFLDGRPAGSSGKAESLASAWRHVTVVFAEGSTEVYVNGERKIHLTTGQELLPKILTDKTVLKIGAANWGRGSIESNDKDKPGELFKGGIDDFAVYDGALDAAQVKYVYDGTKNDQGTETSLSGLELKRTACTMSVGGSLEGTSLVKIPAGAGSRVMIESSDSSVVAATAGNRAVTALKKGTANLTVKWGYGAKVYTLGTVTVTVKDVTPISTYGFEGSLDGATAIKTKLADYGGQAEYAENGHHGKALKLKAPTFKKNGNDTVVDDAGYGVKLKEGKVGADYTVSLWVNAEKGFYQQTPILSLGVGNDSAENWINVAGHWKAHPGTGTTARVWSVPEKGKASVEFNSTKFDAPNGTWTMLTVTQCGNDLRFYVNGKENGGIRTANEVLNQEGALICLGINNWDPSFGGMIDDVNVYDSALGAAQVKSLYLSSLSAEQTAEWLEIKGENESLNCVTEDLSLPTEKDGINITWTAKEGQQNSTAVTAQGKVTAGGGNAVTLTAACSDTQTGVTWSVEIPVKVARKITVKCLDQDKAAGDNEADLIQKEELMKEEDSEYVHTPEEIIFTEAGDAYKYDAGGNKNTSGLKVKVGANAEVHVAYKAVEIKGVVTPDDAYVIEGNDPVLPKKLKVTVDTGNGDTAEANAKVKWIDNYKGLKARKEPYVIRGTVGKKEVSIKVTVFECDAEMPEVEATYTNKETTRYLSLNGSYKGVIETEFDLVNVKKSTRQGAFFLLDKDAKGAWWDNSAALEFDADGKEAKGYYRAVGGNGKGGNPTDSGEKFYPASKDAANAIAYDGTGTYHVRIRLDTTDVDSTVEEGAATVKKNATFRIWMTGEDGKTTELTMGDAATSREIKSGIINRYFVGTYIAAENGDFKVTNHRLSWQSGYVARNIETYIDDVKAADLSGSTKLLPYSLMTEEEQAAYKYKPEPNIMQGGEKCVLQTKESGWFDKDGNPVADDKVAEKAVAGAALTYKAYYKKGAADFAGLGEKIEQAQEQYGEMAMIYTAASLKYLDDAIKAAQAVAATEESGTPASVEAVETAITDLQAAMDKNDAPLVPKDYDAMNEALAAYYPLGKESQAKDDVGGKNGTVNGNVAFTDDGGAAFPGGSSLENYISLPDTLKVTDKMTFSFWAYCDNSADTEANATHKMHNTFCIGSGKKLGNTQGTTAPHHFSIYAGKNGNELAVDAGPNAWNTGLEGVSVEGYKKQEWSLVTVVVDGKKAAIYQDGVRKDSGDIGITLTEAWNASPEERYILLGNNCYAYNGDWDYKGNVKNLRVYNAPLVEKQVKDIFDNEVQGMLTASAGRLADTIKAQPGTGTNEGKYTLAITDSSIKLPKAGKQGEKISWKSYAADGETESTAVINAATGAVTVPEPGADGVTAVLKATITISGVERTFEFICEVKNPINKESTAALKDEAKAAMEGKDKADYEAAVWDELAAAIQAYEALPENASAQEIASIYNRLKAALEAFVPKTVVAVTGVTLSQGSQALAEGQNITLEEGQSVTLTAAVLPQGADQNVTWESSNPAAATVAGGKVTASKAGTAVITAASVADKTKKATCKVTVTAKTQTTAPAAVQNVKLNVKKLTMGVKESYTLKATVNPSSVSNKKVEWKSDKPKVVSVKNGKLKALKTGKAKITATSAADKTKKATITVTVKKAPDKKAKVTLNKKSVKLKVKKTFQIKAKVPSKYGSATFKYTIDKKGKKAVKVDKDGKVTAKKKGKATITVKPYNGKGKSATLKITVK